MEHAMNNDRFALIQSTSQAFQPFYQNEMAQAATAAGLEGPGLVCGRVGIRVEARIFSAENTTPCTRIPILRSNAI